MVSISIIFVSTRMSSLPLYLCISWLCDHRVQVALQIIWATLYAVVSALLCEKRVWFSQADSLLLQANKSVLLFDLAFSKIQSSHTDVIIYSKACRIGKIWNAARSLVAIQWWIWKKYVKKATKCVRNVHKNLNGHHMRNQNLILLATIPMATWRVCGQDLSTLICPSSNTYENAYVRMFRVRVRYPILHTFIQHQSSGHRQKRARFSTIHWKKKENKAPHMHTCNAVCLGNLNFHGCEFAE